MLALEPTMTLLPALEPGFVHVLRLTIHASAALAATLLTAEKHR